MIKLWYGSNTRPIEYQPNQSKHNKTNLNSTSMLVIIQKVKVGLTRLISIMSKPISIVVVVVVVQKS